MTDLALLPEPLQAKLLTVLEERTVRRLGSTRNEPVDVWIIAGTNEDLAGAAVETDIDHRRDPAALVIEERLGEMLDVDHAHARR